MGHVEDTLWHTEKNPFQWILLWKNVIQMFQISYDCDMMKKYLYV